METSGNRANFKKKECFRVKDPEMIEFSDTSINRSDIEEPRILSMPPTIQKNTYLMIMIESPSSTADLEP